MNNKDLDLYDNFQSVLAMVRELLDETEQARLVQALTPRPEVGSVTPYTWMLDSHRLLTSGVQIMDEGQLREWKGWEAAIREAPLREAQRLENLGRLQDC